LVDTGEQPGTTTSEKAQIKELEREVRDLQEANDILKAASTSTRGNSTPTPMIIEFIDAQRRVWSPDLCCLPGVGHIGGGVLRPGLPQRPGRVRPQRGCSLTRSRWRCGNATATPIQSLAGWSITATKDPKADSTGRRNTSITARNAISASASAARSSHVCGASRWNAVASMPWATGRHTPATRPSTRSVGRMLPFRLQISSRYSGGMSRLLSA
jgi:hypothetical protein